MGEGDNPKRNGVFSFFRIALIHYFAFLLFYLFTFLLLKLERYCQIISRQESPCHRENELP